jgi:hypothetical protein
VPASLAESVGDAANSACASAGDVLELGSGRCFSAEVARRPFDGADPATNICCTNEEVGASDDGALAGGDAGLRFPEPSAALPSTIKAAGDMH